MLSRRRSRPRAPRSPPSWRGSPTSLTRRGHRSRTRRAWQGLGYYRRARALHAARRPWSSAMEGSCRRPRRAADLPGIGAYTAAAVGAIAFDLPAVPVDGNVERGRAAASWLGAIPAGRGIDAAAARLAAPERAYDFAQAVMELGALVCTPRAPGCLTCPWRPGAVPQRRPAGSLPPAGGEEGTAGKVRRRVPPRALRRRDPVPSPAAGRASGRHGRAAVDRLAGRPARPRRSRPPHPRRPSGGRLPARLSTASPTSSCASAAEGRSVEQGPAGLWVTPDQFGTLALPTMTLRLLRHAGSTCGAQGRQISVRCSGQRQGLWRSGRSAGRGRRAAAGAGGSGAAARAIRCCWCRPSLQGRGGAARRLTSTNSEEVVAAGDQVDLADMAGEAPGQDAEALKAQEEGREQSRRAVPRPLAGRSGSSATKGQGPAVELVRRQAGEGRDPGGRCPRPLGRSASRRAASISASLGRLRSSGGPITTTTSPRGRSCRRIVGRQPSSVSRRTSSCSLVSSRATAAGRGAQRLGSFGRHGGQALGRFEQDQRRRDRGQLLQRPPPRRPWPAGSPGTGNGRSAARRRQGGEQPPRRRGPAHRDAAVRGLAHQLVAGVGDERRAGVADQRHHVAPRAAAPAAAAGPGRRCARGRAEGGGPDAERSSSLPVTRVSSHKHQVGGRQDATARRA